MALSLQTPKPQRLRPCDAYKFNQCFFPESTDATFNALVDVNGGERYRRVVVPGYGDIDCIIGKNAVRDVFPHILAHLRPAATTPHGHTAMRLNGASAPAIQKA